MSAPPPRRRDRQPGLAKDYYAQHPLNNGGGGGGGDPRYYEYAAPPRRPRSPPAMPSRQYEQPAPRRHKSERRRPLTPEPPMDDPYERPRRHGRRSERGQQPPPRVVNPPSPPPSDRRNKRGPSPPPFAPSPPVPEGARRERDRDRDRDRDRRSRRHERNSMPPPSRDPYAAGAMPAREFAPGPRREERPPKPYRGEPDPRAHRRSRYTSPEPRPRSRDMPQRSRDSMPPRARDYPSPPYLDDRYLDDRQSGAMAGRSRPRSQGRGGPPPPRGASPPRGRPPPGAAGGRDKPKPKPERRNSMPANIKKRGIALWQNPMVQAGARNAFTAGAQAALKSKNDNGPWLGPKGAKVATAALGAALVDGFLGHKAPESNRRELMREGTNAAMDEMDRSRSRRHS